MPVIDTSTLQQGVKTEHDQQIYNGLDSCITFEVHEQLSSLMQDDRAHGRLMYDFERALQAPVLEMTQRGIRVDEYERQKAIVQLNGQIAELQAVLDEFAVAVWDKPLNARSTAQLKDFFYNRMHLPSVHTYNKGVKTLSMNRESLEKLELYIHARPIVATILAIRDKSKLREMFETEIDNDGRYRFSINIAGTETWRFSSSKSSTGTGGNAQNWKRDDDIEDGELSVRSMLVADPGMKFGSMDLEQAEAYEVGWLHGVLFDDWKYLDACEAGDLHTQTARMVWPELPWTGKKAEDRAIADRLFYRHYSHRDISKRGGFLTNYMGTALTAARRLKVPQRVMQDFQDAYAYGPRAAYPAFQLWWQWVAEQLETVQRITTPFGATRYFFSRPNDQATLREAIAFGPQSSTAVRNNLALWRIWRYMPHVQVLLQIHDSVVFQYPDGLDEQRLYADIMKHVDVRLRHGSGTQSREFTVPGELKVGWNLGVFHAVNNPNGMKKIKATAGDDRKRLTGAARIL